MIDMDSRFELTDTRRETPPGLTADTPLTAIAWRIMRAEYQRRAEERKQSDSEARRMRHSLADIAEQAYRLRRIASALGQEEDHSLARQLLAITGRLEESLAEVDITIVAPEGEPFIPALMELFDNIAQQTDPEAFEPRIAEVVAPAITCRGAVLRMGKAVIAVPGARKSITEIERLLGESGPND
jgi:hypothetical protein